MMSALVTDKSLELVPKTFTSPFIPFFKILIFIFFVFFNKVLISVRTGSKTTQNAVEKTYLKTSCDK